MRLLVSLTFSQTTTVGCTSSVYVPGDVVFVQLFQVYAFVEITDVQLIIRQRNKISTIEKMNISCVLWTPQNKRNLEYFMCRKYEMYMC